MFQLDPIAHFIQQIGFPIFVAVMLLVREDKRHADNIAAINKLAAALHELHTCIESRFAARPDARPLKPRSTKRR